MKIKIPLTDYKTNGREFTKVTGTAAYNKAQKKDKDCPTDKTQAVLARAADRYAKINGAPPPDFASAPGSKSLSSAPSAAPAASFGSKKLASKGLTFWGKAMPVIDIPGLPGGPRRIDDGAIREYFETSDARDVTEAMIYAHKQKSVPAFYGKVGQAGPLDIFYRTIGREQFVRLDLALLFTLAGDEHGTALGKAIAVSDPSTIDVAFRVITRMKPIVNVTELDSVLDTIANVACELRLEDVVGTVTPEEKKDTFGWFNTCDLLRKGATMVSIHLQGMDSKDLATFDADLKALVSRSDEQQASSAIAEIPTSDPKEAMRKVKIALRRDAMRAGMLVAGALDAACAINSQDQATLSALKNAVGGIVGGACGAGLMAGAIIGPLATAAVNAAFDAAWTTRDFKKAAQCLRAHLEVTKLNASDLSEVENESNADADRYFHWINATVHAMGHA